MKIMKKKRRRRLQFILGGADERWEIEYATWTPVKQTGLLTFSGGRCSGTLVGPKTVLTAGHCVHSGKRGNWYNKFVFYPGRTSTSTSPYKSYTYSTMMTFEGWILNSDFDWDIALVELSSVPSPDIQYNYLGYDNNINTNYYFHGKGYPGNKPYGSMWSTEDYISQTTTNQLRTDDTDSYYGYSGSPFYCYDENNVPIIYAAHSGAGFDTKYYHRHTRITSTKFATFCTWINNPSVC